MSGNSGPPFSRRLDWPGAENPLAVAEARLREMGERLIDLTSSNPTAVDLPDDDDDLRRAFARAAMSRYEPSPRGARSAREHVAAAYREVGAPIDPDRLILTASSSESYSFLFKLLANAGDAVLVPEPSYPLFDYLAALDGLTVRRYRLAHESGAERPWAIDRASIDEALARRPPPPPPPRERVPRATFTRASPARVAAVVVVSPNHPTGSVLRGDDLRWLDQRCGAAGVAIVSDEVFSDYVTRAGPDPVRCVAAHPTDSLSFSLGGLSKSCGLPQLKLGWIAVGGGASVARAALERLDLIADTYLSVGTPVQAALPDLLALGARRRAAIVARITENRRTLARAIGERSPLSLLGSEGGWSAIVRVPAIRNDEEWALALLEDRHVLTQPGYFFDLDPANGAFLVLSLLPPPSTFASGVERLVSYVEHVTGSDPTRDSPMRPSR